MKYTIEAEAFIQRIDKFDRWAFEGWISSLVLQIGSETVIQYLEEKERWNCKSVLKNKQLKCDFSNQANKVIEQLNKFDSVDCKIWFSNALRLTKTDILSYLEQKR